MNMDLKENKQQIGFKYALSGIKYVCTHERNFRIHLLALLVVLLAGIIGNISPTEWMFLLMVSGVVLIAEMTNSALELMIDFMKPAIHPTAKVIKDIAAGAVLIAALVAVVVGCIIFIPKVIEYI